MCKVFLKMLFFIENWKNFENPFIDNEEIIENVAWGGKPKQYGSCWSAKVERWLVTSFYWPIQIVLNGFTNNMV